MQFTRIYVQHCFDYNSIKQAETHFILLWFSCHLNSVVSWRNYARRTRMTRLRKLSKQECNSGLAHGTVHPMCPPDGSNSLSYCTVTQKLNNLRKFWNIVRNDLLIKVVDVHYNLAERKTSRSSKKIRNRRVSAPWYHNLSRLEQTLLRFCLVKVCFLFNSGTYIIPKFYDMVEMDEMVQELTQAEAELYDRQIRLWGLDNQKR